MENSSVKELERKYFLNSPNTNLVIERGDGNLLYDNQGNFYIDFTSGRGENVLGYNDPDLLKAIEEQASKLINISDMYFNAQQALLVENLIEGTSFKKVLLSMNGSEALTAAMQMTRSYYKANGIKKNNILLVTDSLRTISLGRAFSEQFPMMGIRFTPQNDFEKLRQNLTDDVGTIILETIQVENSMRTTTYDFMLNAYALAKSKGVFIIMNELVTGVGRTGNMFSYEPLGIQPDVVVISKGLGGGLPISAVLASKNVSSCYNIDSASSPFYSNVLACAAANVVIGKLKNGMLEKISEIGDYLKAKLSKFNKYNFVLDIRGSGLIMGIELSPKLNAKEVTGRLAKENVLIGTANKNTIVFTPPYTITRRDIDFMSEKLENFFASTSI